MSEEKKGADRLDTSSTDAMHWAECFCEQVQINSDAMESKSCSNCVHLEPGFLVGWFANYWAAVHDPMHNTIQSLQQEVERLRDYAYKWNELLFEAQVETHEELLALLSTEGGE